MSISLLAAFLGGLISLLSPCSALVLPTFFATSFHQKKRLITATLIFSLGILTIMIPLGLGLLVIIRTLNTYRRIITLVIGIILIIEGLLQLTGRSLFIPKISQKAPTNKFKGLSYAFYLGLISGVGAMSCVGPILGAIITLAANSVSLTGALILIFAFTAGLVGPLFLLALLWQKNQAKVIKLLRGKVITLGNFKIHSVNLAAALLFLFLGYVFIKFQGSLGLMPLFTHSGILNFTFDLQDALFKL